LCAAFDDHEKASSQRPPGVFEVGVLPKKTELEVANMPGKSPGPSVKKPKTYEALKKKGMSKSRAARISNAQAKKSR
jgi:hypothetical protein